MDTFRIGEDFARDMDAKDPLRSLRDEFHIPPGPDGRPSRYFAGNSLGLQPRGVRAYLEEEMAAWADRARKVMPGGNTRSVLHFDPFPFRVDRADGKYLWDVDGHRYVDLLGNYTAGLLRHSPEPVLKAARAALDSGWSLGAVHADEVQLAELLVQRFPSLEQVRFTNSGTEANLRNLEAASYA